MFIVGSKAPNCTIGVVAIDTVKYTCFGVVAQLVRASPCHGEGRGSEPRQPRITEFLKSFSPFGAMYTVFLLGSSGEAIIEACRKLF